MSMDEIIKKQAELEYNLSILQNQFKLCLEAIADSKTAIMIASNAQAMASEALIKATTGKSLDELAQGDPTFDDDPGLGENPRRKFYSTLGGKKD